MIFKPKSPIGKENARTAGYFNEYSKLAPSQYPNPHSPISQNYFKSKTNPNLTYDPTPVHPSGDDLICDEVLEEIPQETRRVRKQTEPQPTLLC